MIFRRHLALPALAAASLLLASCASSPSGADSDAGSGTAASGGSVRVLASFYPLQYVSEQVGGDRVDVQSLTPPGAEPHDVELSPRQVRSVGEVDLVVYLSGFQASVDEAIAAREPALVVDAATSVNLIEGDGALDPHFWLDPSRLAKLAAPVAAALAEADPDHQADYAAGAAALEADLAGLDSEFAAGLATCTQRVIVTSHEAFGYLADRYDLEQVGISGLDPEAEPSPARLREIGDVVRAQGVTTIFSEELVNPKVTQTLAADLGVTSAVLDPVESLADPSSDYRGVMSKNLGELRAALACT